VTFPERAQRLDDEFTRRAGRTQQTQESQPTQAVLDAEQAPLTRLSLKFSGSAQEYFRVWIVNLCLTSLTLGIYSAWGKVRKKRYLYSHTTLGGTPFQYLGQPIPILKGRLVAAGGLLVYWAASHFITSALPYVLVAGLVLAPWVLTRSLAFNARYSAFRNMTFHFDGGYLDAAKALYAWGIAPAAVLGTAFASPAWLIVSGVAWALFGFSYPWWIRRLKKFSIERTSFGGVHGHLGATGGQFFRVYLLAGVMITVVVIAGLVFSVTLPDTLRVFGISAVGYAAYLAAFAYTQARIGNLVWNQVRLGPLRFESTLRWWDLMKLYVTNVLAIAASVGMLTPWAVMRTLRYRADHMRVLLASGALASFQGSDRSAVEAVSAESVDLFDMDLSL
jgi:uncharacterized membrane protein YjgN (DUF898 family)